MVVLQGGAHMYGTGGMDPWLAADTTELIPNKSFGRRASLCI